MKMASLQFYALFLFIGLHLSAGDETFPKTIIDGTPCQDCTQIFKLLADLLSNADLQKKLIGEVERLCDYVPGPPAYKQKCKDEVEEILPVAISFLTGVMRPEQVCTLLHLCGTPVEAEQLLDSILDALEDFVSEEKGGPAPQCSFCLLLLQTLEDLIPKEKTESAVLDLMKQICLIFPAGYRKECEIIVHQYGKLVLEAVMRLASPQSICSLIHMCRGDDKAPHDPCVVRSYMCRDYDTALNCATLPFCQKFVWNQV